MPRLWFRATPILLLACAWTLCPAKAPADAPPKRKSNLSLLDAPILFVKRHAYMAGHIYDDYLTWRPGGGIYVIENPTAPPEEQRVRPIIDPGTQETLGPGVYRDPELSWDGTRVLFAFKGAPSGGTSIFEIGIDGTGLRRLTDADCGCVKSKATKGAGHHDITPCYLANGRIAFTSTRNRALVPCFDSGVDTLHVMDADGSNVRSISVNNVNEFDPAVMHDGRILFGRWEYVDKTALYMQSLWTIAPDGRMEEALFGNNLAKPTAILDARPVPGSHLIAATLTPHNGQSVGAIVTIDPRKGKNDLDAIVNFTPEYPTEMDQGLKKGPSDPWPLSPDVMLIANNAKGHAVIELIDRSGHREVVHAESDISCYSPILVKPRPRPPAISPSTEPALPGQFLVVDVHQGLSGVPRGTVKRLRVVEETARVSGLPPGGRWWNQAFLVSWQGAYSVKNVLGTVPVHEDGSAYFTVPPGKAVYFEALDGQGREVQRMRTFVQAAPGSMRSCIGCHEEKYSAPALPGVRPLAMHGEPAQPQPESWGTGYIDYPSMIQPVLDKHCTHCHGGRKGMAAGIDLSGGWTWAFSISYETLIKHQLVGFLNCHNSSVHTAEILPPRSAGSGAAPLAELLISGHGDRIPDMTRAERDLLLAWMDTNGNFHGTWDYTQFATCNAILNVRQPLGKVMNDAGCSTCHAENHIGNDWINLQTPSLSRILRAPMAESPDGPGLAVCRKRRAATGYPLIDQRVRPPDIRLPSRQPKWNPSGEVHVSFDSTENTHYQAMLQIITDTRDAALAQPRVDMPGAQIIAGECRSQVPLPLPDKPPELRAAVAGENVRLSWPQTAKTIGLHFELHRGNRSDFAPDSSTRLGATTNGQFVDREPTAEAQHYALVPISGNRRGKPARATVKRPGR